MPLNFNTSIYISIIITIYINIYIYEICIRNDYLTTVIIVKKEIRTEYIWFPLLMYCRIDLNFNLILSWCCTVEILNIMNLVDFWRRQLLKYFLRGWYHLYQWIGIDSRRLNRYLLWNHSITSQYIWLDYPLC